MTAFRDLVNLQLFSQAKEEEEYRQWLKGEKSELGQDKQAAVDLVSEQLFLVSCRLISSW